MADSKNIIVIKIAETDNVGVVANSAGLRKVRLLAMTLS